MKISFQFIIPVLFLAVLLLQPVPSFAGPFDDLANTAEQGQVEAQLKLGDAYYFGKGTEKNLQQALFWYEKAAQQGNPKAQRALGAMYELGRGTAKQPEKAAYWYQKAAEQGLARAQTNLGILYETGEGVDQDYDAALLWYQKAAEQGYARGQTYLGRMFELGIGVEVDFKQAFNWYQKAAEQGYARAQTNLGALYEAGQGVEQNYAKALEWYRKAAEQRYPRGQFYLGQMLEKGLGTEKNRDKALYWYSEAAALGYAQARDKAAALKLELAETGKRIQKDIQEPSGESADTKPADAADVIEEAPDQEQSPLPAEDTLQAAAKTGNPSAQNSLALLYLNGDEGYDKDAAKAALWFRKAAEAGNVDAQNNLGLLYLNGQGVQKDLQEAALWLQKAAEAGNVAAQSNLGLMYFYGEGVEKDYQQSAFWLLKAAKQGYVTAQNNLAVMYSDGLGVEQNQEQAIYWLQKAAEQGDPTARKNLAMLVVNKPEATTTSIHKSDSQGEIAFSPSTETKKDAEEDLPVSDQKSDINLRQAAKEHFRNGNQHAKEGAFDLAIVEYKKAIAIDPNNSNTYENMAISFAKIGNFPSAVKSMQTAIRLSPDDAMKYSTLGIIYHADNKLKYAQEQYMRSIRLNPGFGEMYYNMAVIHSELEQPENAFRYGLQAQRLGYKGSSKFLIDLKKDNPDLSEIALIEHTGLHLRHIVTSTHDEAEYALGKLREGEDFIQIAAQFSLPPYNLNGGYIGPFTPNELSPEITDAVVELPPLVFSQVVETSAGFHIFQKFKVDEELLESR